MEIFATAFIVSKMFIFNAGSNADVFYALAIAPIVKNKVNVKAKYDPYRNNAEWNSAKTFYEVGADYYFTKNLRLSAEYA